MVVLDQKLFLFVKVVVFGQKWLNSEKSGCIRANLLYLGKIGFIRAKSLYWQSGCIWEYWFFWAKLFVFGQWCLYSGKVVVFVLSSLYSGRSGCIRPKWLYSGKSGCIRAKLVVFGKSGCTRAKVVVIGIRLFYLGKVVVFA